MGIDLGQSHDPSTIAVVERKEVQGEWDAAQYTWRKHVGLRLRYLERIPLGTPYPDIVERLRDAAQSRELAGRCRMVVDATGVGRPVVDLLQRARPGCPITPVTVTGGERETSNGDGYCVPKRDLISGLQVLLQTGGLEIAQGLRFTKELLEEMGTMRVKVSAAGREQYGAWREGEHDDLVFAVSLACWGAKKFYGLEDGWWTNEHGAALMGRLV